MKVNNSNVNNMIDAVILTGKGYVSMHSFEKDSLEEAVDEKATDENGYIGQSVIRGNNIA